jgi:hypothetical protein
MQYVWKYRDSHRCTVKHAFYNERVYTSFCGYSMPWYVRAEWQTDEEGLNSRRECKRCIYTIKVNEGTATSEDHHGVAKHPS